MKSKGFCEQQRGVKNQRADGRKPFPATHQIGVTLGMHTFKTAKKKNLNAKKTPLPIIKCTNELNSSQRTIYW